MRWLVGADSGDGTEAERVEARGIIEESRSSLSSVRQSACYYQLGNRTVLQSFVQSVREHRNVETVDCREAYRDYFRKTRQARYVQILFFRI